MAQLQTQFQNFHRNIKVESETLKEKRDKIYKRIRNTLSEDQKPVPEILNQGSYIYGVGIKPSSGEDYDIDVGLVFHIKSVEYEPKTVRSWVFNAIKNHTEKVEDKGPCIRVNYKENPPYHVDLVCYAKYKDDTGIENFQLANKKSLWISSDPKKIKEHIKKAREQFTDTKDSSGSDQLQRIVRYLKRWNDLSFAGAGDDKPIGLALLLYCVKVLQLPCHDSQGNADDLQAFIQIAETAKNSHKIIANKPDTQENVFGKISDKGMQNLILKFQELYEGLLQARNSDNLETACKIIRNHLGDDFPLDENLIGNQNLQPMQRKNIAIQTERPWRNK